MGKILMISGAALIILAVILNVPLVFLVGIILLFGGGSIHFILEENL